MPVLAVRPTVPLREPRMDGLVLRQASFLEHRVPGGHGFTAPCSPCPRIWERGKGLTCPSPRYGVCPRLHLPCGCFRIPFKRGKCLTPGTEPMYWVATLEVPAARPHVPKERKEGT